MNIYEYYTKHAERVSTACIAAHSTEQALQLVKQLTDVDNEGDWDDDEIELKETNTILGEPRVVYFLSTEY